VPESVSKLETIVLAMLAEGPMYGYQALERMRERGVTEWAGIARASVYQALRRRERAGDVTSRAEDGREGPDRRTYRITRSGRARLRRGLLERFEGAAAYETEVAVGLAFAHLLAPEELRAGIRRRAEAVEARRTRLAETRARVRRMPGPGSAVAARLLEEQEAFAAAELATLTAIRRDMSRSRR
jgi:DNA-binding PadR family transcriptional regulator